MKLTHKKIDDYNIELTVEVEADNFDKAIKTAVKTLAERVTVKGFRKGKIPQAVLEKHIGKDAIIDEAGEIVINNSSREALRMLNLTPVTELRPKIVTKEAGKDFVYTLTFTPYPKVTLGEYKNLDAEKIVEAVTDEQVAEQLEQMRGHHANLIEAAADDAVADGDFITLDYTGTIDGEKFTGGEAKDQPLEIGSHKFIGDFEEQLIGAKVGDERTVKVTFPDDYHAKDLAGKDAEFACKINSIKHRELPELNDEFAKKVSTFQTLDEYKADIRKNMEAAAERRAVEAQRQAVIDKAVANMTIDLPPVMIENRITQMIRELDANLQTQGMNLEQYMAFSGIDTDKLRDDYRESARKNVLTDILLENVADAEKISVNDQELNLEISMLAQMYRTPPKQLAKYLKDSGQLFTVADTIRRRKAMKFILDNMAGAVKADEAKPDEADKVDEVTTDTVTDKADKVDKTTKDS
ncbi:MAG: trigger factor [Selenomonadaceae bacterium]|nr:trigger factor [Selenomonadaceae bacterium]